MSHHGTWECYYIPGVCYRLQIFKVHLGCRQLGIVSFGPLQPHMLDLYTGSHAALPTLPGVPTLAAALDRNWSSSESSKSPTAPALVGFSFCLSH